jgi:4-amino-4-deoxy-L-arabinose transferase-like glycosyltransferase
MPGVGLKLLSPILGSLTLYLLYLIAKQIFSKKIAAYSSFFLAFIPIYLLFSYNNYIAVTLTFFITLSVFFMLRNKVALSGLSMLCALFTKYNALFIVPLLLLILYDNNKTDKKLVLKSASTFLVFSVLGSLWFLRNLIYFGNPIWPFMNSVFKGIVVDTVSKQSLSIVKLLDPSVLSSFFLEIFGVPHGSIQAFSFVQIPFLAVLILFWVIINLLFLMPLVYGFFGLSKKQKYFLFIWIIPFFFMVLLHAMNWFSISARLIIPTLPALAMVWGHGLDKIFRKFSKKTLVINLIVLFLLSLTLVYSGQEALKVSIARSAWGKYDGDFKWVKENTPKDSLFYYNGQCLWVNIDRRTTPLTDKLEANNYIWVNPIFSVEQEAVLSEETIEAVKEKHDLVYSNNKTKTEIYRINS